MDRFLNSFDDNITIDSGDATHKSVDHKQGSTEQKKTLTRFSTLTREDLDEQSAKDFDTFQRQGFVIMEDVLSAEEVKALQKDTSSILAGASFGDNKFYGRKTKRAYALLAKTLTVVPLLASPRINTLIDALFAPNALLSALQLVEIHPGEVEQTLHYDQQFQNIHPSRDPFSNDPFVVNCILAIDDFTPEKGGTTLLPGSHLWPVGRLPTPDDPRINLTMKAGSVCCFSGLLWHAGGANITSEARKGLITSFTQPWFRPLENLFLAVPFKVAIDLPPIVQTRMGYSLHHPFTGQVDFKHPIHKLKELASL